MMNRFSAWGALSCILLCALHAYSQGERERQVLTIEKMFSLLEENDKALRPAQEGVKGAQEGLKEAKNARLPDVSASLSFLYIGDGWMSDRDFGNGANADMPHYGNNFSIEASQVIYAGGAVASGVKLAELARQSAEVQVEAKRGDERFLLVGDYMDLFKQRNLLEVYDSNIVQTRRVLRDMRAKESQGIVLRNDITRYELLLETLKQERLRISNTVEILNTRLVVRLGMEEGTEIVPDTALLRRALPEKDRAEWVAAASGRSHSLRQLALAGKMSKSEEDLARAERLPQVALVAANQFNGPILIEVPPIDKNFNYWYVGVGVKYNIASLYKSNKTVRKRRYATLQLARQYDDALEQTRLLVNAEYVRYREAQEQLRSREKSVELARQNYDVVRNRYANELALVTDMLDANNAKLMAEVELANARVSIIFNYYKLLYLSGNI